MSTHPDFLYDLVPVVYRLRDADQGYPLRAVLRVLAGQAEVIEQDIAGLYENWFIETCDDWVVPYIGALIGYTPLSIGPGLDAAETGCSCAPAAAGANKAALRLERILVPRTEVANTIRMRRRKGTLCVLDDIASGVSGWPAHAVEFYRRLALTQNINFLHPHRGRLIDVREPQDWRGAAFDARARTVDVRRIDSARTPGSANIPEVGVYVWRLRAYTVSTAPACCYEAQSQDCFLFSALGNDTQLYVNPATGDAAEPLPISRHALASSNLSGMQSANGAHTLYGAGHSMSISTGIPPVPVDASRLVVADLTGWTYRPLPGHVAIDPVLGRFMFAPGEARGQAVTVSYAYGFSADLGGGEYARTLDEAPGAAHYTVGHGGTFAHIGDALARWGEDAPVNAVIEIVDSGVYTEALSIALKPGQSLQLRAANRCRPVLRLLDWQVSGADALAITGEGPAWFQLDGVIVTGRGVQIGGSLSGVTIRHCTLVPGWGLHCDCGPMRPSEPGIVVTGSLLCLRIEKSIVGAIRIDRDEVHNDPLKLSVSGSMIDALGSANIALGADAKLCAYAVLTLRCSTVIGQIQTHEIELAVNSILDGVVRVCRRQAGCMRFCYVSPGSRTPSRYECQPDLVAKAVGDAYLRGDLTVAQRDAMLRAERLRVEPDFDSERYGTLRYGRLSGLCAPEIRMGADDESEMGMLHGLYEPQRAANLGQRLNEFTPAGTDAGIIFAS
ncbi:hypothetical protein [Paraburkholderia guartelaensis]|uniref:hypothetical protein n=1 Tax=Paraburkholderia guartelaensis TaxID=2546446 RepID=UPI002AB6675B|nr:hypothetical protein [Paraburkholderia guartelaensis]